MNTMKSGVLFSRNPLEEQHGAGVNVLIQTVEFYSRSSSTEISLIEKKREEADVCVTHRWLQCASQVSPLIPSSRVLC